MASHQSHPGRAGRIPRWGAALAAAAVAGAAACASSLEGIGTFPCADNGGCPEGWECDWTSEMCVSTTAGGPDAGPPTRECETHDECTDGSKDGVCVAVRGGGSACTLTCTGLTASCGSLDCKLILSGEAASNDLVPACTVSGTADEGETCKSVNSCVAGYTCASISPTDTSSYVCTEICTPFKSTCSNSRKSCKFGVDGYPADWGLCYL